MGDLATRNTRVRCWAEGQCIRENRRVGVGGHTLEGYLTWHGKENGWKRVRGKAHRSRVYSGAQVEPEPIGFT